MLLHLASQLSLTLLLYLLLPLHLSLTLLVHLLLTLPFGLAQLLFCLSLLLDESLLSGLLVSLGLPLLLFN